MKMKIIILYVVLSTYFFSQYLSFRWIWIIIYPAVFTVKTIIQNNNSSHHILNDLPNSIRVFLATLSGVITFFPLSILFLISALFLNDELQRRLLAWKGVIVLSGIDSSGKSTHIKNIQSYFINKGIQCEQIAFSQYVLIPKLHALFKRKASNLPKTVLPGNSSITSTRRFLRLGLTTFRFYLALFDNFLLFIVKVIPAIIQKKYVLCDRFIWDTCIKHKVVGYNVKGLHLLSVLIKPWKCLIFDVSSNVAVKRVAKRKNHIQYTKEQYEIERKFFRGLAHRFNYPIISTNKPISETENLIFKEIQQWK